MAVTIKDVAKAARVSVATVSRALSGSDKVTDETRRQVGAAATKLGYVPHEAARSLSSRRTRCIGVVLPDLHGEFFSELIRGIDRAARTHGLHLLLSSSHGDAAELAAALLAMRGRVDGLLVMSSYADRKVLDNNLQPTLPTVLMNSGEGSERYPALLVDNFGGASAMVRHLVGRGHRHIAMIGGPVENVDARERVAGYTEALEELLPEARPQVLRGDFSEESGYKAGRRLVSMAERPEAIFAANDMMAIGCIFALTEAGLRVPGDIAVAGFDDIPIARYVSPALTTVRVRIAELGELALERLVLAITERGQDRHSVQKMRTELVIRSSCARHSSRMAIVPRSRR
ncbi:MAG TPA: LacI family DNA-binding transcriptional regulator [Usitatibacter sp.]|jgi:LacI family transcriptional regulator|nr:LacI family DNA-binding transcriptional regulator [Usitatibacter sp.]